jgi:hypothetical protein
VSLLPDGRTVVAWQSQSQDGDGWGVYAQALTDAGDKEGDELAVNTTVAGKQMHPAVAGTAGAFAVVWAGEDKDTGSWEVWGKCYDIVEEQFTSEFQVNTHVAEDQGNAVITTLAGGGFAVIWVSTGQCSVQKVFATFVSKNRFTHPPFSGPDRTRNNGGMTWCFGSEKTNLKRF